MSRPYRARLNPAWRHYSLFTARGRDAAFLEEDLSTLALITTWDRYLRPGGMSAVVLRPASMQSHLAAQGLRRLSVRAEADPLALNLIRVFDGIRPFVGTAVSAATWCLTKGLCHTRLNYMASLFRMRKQMTLAASVVQASRTTPSRSYPGPASGGAP